MFFVRSVIEHASQPLKTLDSLSKGIIRSAFISFNNKRKFSIVTATSNSDYSSNPDSNYFSSFKNHSRNSFGRKQSQENESFDRSHQNQDNRYSNDDSHYRKPYSYNKNPNTYRPYPSRYGNSLPPLVNLPVPNLVHSEYIEHAELKDLSDNEIANFRKANEMTVNGSNIPKPIIKFHQAPFPVEFHKKLTSLFPEPTPIQSQGWAVALNGNNLIGISQTGSGKTLSFLLPALKHIKEQEKERPVHKLEIMPIALILAPTRELTSQILDVARNYGNEVGIHVASAYGGASKNMQLKMLRGAGLVIATPGRLIDFLNEGQVNLSRCSFIVLDEADRMLDMGFEPQLRQIIPSVRQEHQTLLWSATWPKAVQNLAHDFLQQGNNNNNNQSAKNTIQITVGSQKLCANKKIQQNFILTSEEDKYPKLRELLLSFTNNESSSSSSPPKAIIFTNTKRAAEDVNYRLQMDRFSSIAIHGDKSQFERAESLNRFKQGYHQILVATDVAARGLDVKDIYAVINYELPQSGAEDYIHRIGRTARGSDIQGFAYTFIEPKDGELIKDIAEVVQEAGQKVPPEVSALIPARQVNNWKGRRYDNFSPRRRFNNNNHYSNSNNNHHDHGNRERNHYNRHY